MQRQLFLAVLTHEFKGDFRFSLFKTVQIVQLVLKLGLINVLSIIVTESVQSMYMYLHFFRYRFAKIKVQTTYTYR